MIWDKVGSADETPGQVRARAFLRTPVFKGTAKHPRARSSRPVLKIGLGNEIAFTYTDYTAIFFGCRAISSAA